MLFLVLFQIATSQHVSDVLLDRKKKKKTAPGTGRIGGGTVQLIVWVASDDTVLSDPKNVLFFWLMSLYVVVVCCWDFLNDAFSPVDVDQATVASEIWLSFASPSAACWDLESYGVPKRAQTFDKGQVGPCVGNMANIRSEPIWDERSSLKGWKRNPMKTLRNYKVQPQTCCCVALVMHELKTHTHTTHNHKKIWKKKR